MNPYSLIALAIAAFVSTGTAFSAQRTFVASYGNDANTSNNCSIVLPCRQFLAALTVTNPKGEIIVLNSAGYGAVTIVQAVSIVAPPVFMRELPSSAARASLFLPGPVTWLCSAVSPLRARVEPREFP